MVSALKKLVEMRSNPRDWRIDDLKTVARRHGVEWERPGTSHVTFRASGRDKVTIPAHTAEP